MIPSLVFAFIAVISIAAAIAVYLDASKQERCALGLWPIWWAAATLVTNLVGVAVYWAIHHSTLKPKSGETPVS